MKRWIALALVIVSMGLSVNAQVKSTTVQALLIYSAIRYMEWPENNTSDFEITVLGASPLYAELTNIAQTKKAGIKRIVVTKVSNASEIKTKPHILFVSSDKTNQLNKVSEESKTSMLIITEANGLKSGSDLNFVQQGDKISFQLSEESLAEKKIKVSSAFSNLAKKIN